MKNFHDLDGIIDEGIDENIDEMIDESRDDLIDNDGDCTEDTNEDGCFCCAGDFNVDENIDLSIDDSKAHFALTKSLRLLKASSLGWTGSLDVLTFLACLPHLHIDCVKIYHVSE